MPATAPTFTPSPEDDPHERISCPEAFLRFRTLRRAWNVLGGPVLVREALQYRPCGWPVASPDHLKIVAIGLELARTYAIEPANDKRADRAIEGVEKFIATRGASPTTAELEALRAGTIVALEDRIGRIVKFNGHVDAWVPHAYRAIAEVVELALTGNASHLADVMRYVSHDEGTIDGSLGDVVRRHIPNPPAWIAEPPGAEFVKD